jgi:hypothetical protein
MKRSRILYEKDIIDCKYKNGLISYDVKLGVYGVFDTSEVKWTYYLISFYTQGGKIMLTEDLCSHVNLDPYSAHVNCDEIKSVEEGMDFIEDFKIKWETGSNDSKS